MIIFLLYYYYLLVMIKKNNQGGGVCIKNIIAAFLLCYLEEEVAFWTLAAICEDLAPENYDKNMIGSIVDVQAFEDLLARFLPQISTQMKAFNIPVTVITQGWFLCLFVGYLPLEATLRTLDNFFFSRGKMLFATALAIFKCCEQRILSAKEPDELMVLLKDLHDVMKDEEMMSLLLKVPLFILPIYPSLSSFLIIIIIINTILFITLLFKLFRIIIRNIKDK